MSVTVSLSSARGVLAQLDEPDDALKTHALRLLDALVDHYWQEIAPDISKLEALSEDGAFPSRSLAASVASKVYYHLEDLDDALKFALGAGELFDLADDSEYIQTLISKCIDEYIAVRLSKYKGDEERQMDPRLETIVGRMFERCFQQRQFKQVLGVAVEAENLDMIEQAIMRSNDVAGMLSYCYELSQTVVTRHSFRQALLRVLVKLYRSQSVPDYISMCQCLLFLQDHETVAQTLNSLIDKTPVKDALMAYQVAVDLAENQNQVFLDRVSKSLPVVPVDPQAPAAATAPGGSGSGDDSYASRMEKLRTILDGQLFCDKYLDFLFFQNKADLNILRTILPKLDPRNVITHTAMVMCNSFMYCGTASDPFIRENLDWLKKAFSWSKFTATASLGVIHKGHTKDSSKLMARYLPSNGQNGSSPYEEGGALYAMGLIHANAPQSAAKLAELRTALRNAGTNEIVQHGACLGIGLTGMATGSEEVYEELKNVMFTDSAVAGEAAAIAMGLVQVGNPLRGQSVEDMVNYAHDTKHEKIIRGLAMGLALMCYAQEEDADPLIEQLVLDKDPILRYGAMYAIALAYVATSNHRAIKRLLHFAVSDVSNDVRRAAVTALGFVLCKEPEQLPVMVSLLAESFNPHVRYGAAFAIGIACAGSGLPAALELLQALMKDSVDIVRQAAFIATAMVLIQHNKNKEPVVEILRNNLNEVHINSRKHDSMAKFGSLLGMGILDAGGRNVTISLVSPAGHKKMAAIVGMALFPQFWYWYPLTHMLSLCFSPTAVIGLNKDLKVPADFTFISKAKPSLFAYPPPIEVKKEEKKAKLPTAQLTVTQKAAAIALKRQTSGDSASGDAAASAAASSASASPPTPSSSSAAAGETKPEEEKKDGAAVAPSTPAAPEPEFEELKNPARVTLAQQKLLTYNRSQRYQPVKKNLSGFVLLVDTQPDQPENLFNPGQVKPAATPVEPIAEEPAPPQAFDFVRM